MGRGGVIEAPGDDDERFFLSRPTYKARPRPSMLEGRIIFGVRAGLESSKTMIFTHGIAAKFA